MKPFSLSIASALLILIPAGCSASATTVTAPPVTTTAVSQAPPITVTATTTQPVSIAATTTITQAPLPAVTTTTITTKTVTPTFMASIYQGSMTGAFTGKTSDGTAESGTYIFTIDANGDINGTFQATLAGVQYAGTMTGEVDLIGNMIAMGGVSGSAAYTGATWSAHISISGSNMSVQGTWGGESASGTFSGTGTLSH
jgi:hypothetical protein